MLAAVALLMVATMGQGQTERDELIAKAMASTRAAIAIAEKDLDRPTYHFRGPSNWMNDPNGTITHDGWTHVFYQHNPYGEQWGHMHWGHARSRNMVDWEHLPIALWPTLSKGEEHIYSGSTFIDPNGQPIAFYTSIGNRPPEQWSARPVDKDWITWQKVDQPDLTIKAHGNVDVREWRDPFLFRDAGKDFLITGGNINGKGGVYLYEATNKELTGWKCRGPMFEHPTAGNIECPNIGKIGDKWVLLMSPHGAVEAFMGSFDFVTGKFTSQSSSIVADGSYASQLLRDKDGRLVHIAWVKTEDRQGWNGWLTLPSVLTLSADGKLLRNPIAALEELRTGEDLKTGGPVDGTLALTSLYTDHFEAEIEVVPGNSRHIKFNLGRVWIELDLANGKLSSSATPEAPFTVNSVINLRVFLDGAAVDIYANKGETTLSGVIAKYAKPHAASVTADGAGTSVSVKFWKLRPAKFDLSRFK